MLSYSCVAWTLTGKISKTVFALDRPEDALLTDAGRIITQGAIKEG